MRTGLALRGIRTLSDKTFYFPSSQHIQNISLIFTNLPIALGDIVHFRLEAVRMIAFIATITKKKFILIFARGTKLAIL